MARSRPTHATQYDFRDTDIMFKIAENNGHGISTLDIADLLGFDKEEGGRPVGIRLAWMKKFGMVAFDDDNRLWSLSQSGRRVTAAHLRAPALRVVESLPDETMVETMGLVLSRFQKGDSMLGHMLRREFVYATQKR
jgi:hypothetical protein